MVGSHGGVVDRLWLLQIKVAKDEEVKVTKVHILNITPQIKTNTFTTAVTFRSRPLASTETAGPFARGRQ